jgi:hypothetical protein
MFRAVLTSLLLIAATAAQAAGPLPPCAASPQPGYPEPNATPVFSIWHETDLKQGNWQPSACTGWANPSRTKLAIAFAGTFRAASMEAILSRLGAMSAMRAVKYWSTTDSKWRPLANDAFALTNADAKSRRADLAPAEFKKGETLYYWMDDTRFGAVTYRATVLDSSGDLAVIKSENVTPIRQFVFTIFEPGALQSVIFLQRLQPGVFGVYILTRTSDGASLLSNWHDSSYVNRSMALYRQLAGIRTDQEPPALR